MDIVKKRIVPIVCGVIAIVCIVLIFFPLGGMYSRLQEDVEKSKKVKDNIDNILKKQRTWPTLSSHEEDRVPLKEFPTDAIIRRGEDMTKSWKNTTDNFQFAAIKLQRDALVPLVEGALPGQGTGQQLAYQFQDAYLNRFAQRFDPVSGKRITKEAIYNKILRREDTPVEIPGSGMPPAATDIADRVAQVTEQTTEQVKREVGGVIQNPEEVKTKVDEAVARVPTMMRAQAASHYVVYFDPETSLVMSPNVAGTTAPKVNDMYQAQVNLWVQEEVCRAIRDTNAGATKGVIDAPIKRLIKLNVQPRYMIQPVPAGTTPAVPPLPTTKVDLDFQTNPLGHKNNDFYDVIRFDLDLVCEARQLPDVLAGLSRGRYIMFRNLHLLSIDASVAQAQGFLYGDKPVISLQLEGQYLVLREFIKPFMPADVISGLALQPGNAPGAAPVPMGGPPAGPEM